MSHIQANHGGRDETYKQVRTYAGWGVLKDLVHEYIQNCPTCIKARTSKAAHSRRSTAKKPSTRLSTTAATKTSMDSRIESGSPLRLDTSALPGVSSPEQILCPEKCLHPLVQASFTIVADGQNPEAVVKLYDGRLGGPEALVDDPTLPAYTSGAGSYITPPISTPSTGSQHQFQLGDNALDEVPLPGPGFEIDPGNLTFPADNAMCCNTAQPMLSSDGWGMAENTMLGFDPTQDDIGWMADNYLVAHLQPQQQQPQPQPLPQLPASQAPHQSFDHVQSWQTGLEDFVLESVIGNS